MPLLDLHLEKQLTGYALTGTTVDEITRMRGRIVTQFMSQRARERGSIFASELAAGRIRTNADVVTLFSLAMSQILDEERQYAQEIVPYRAELLSFAFVDARTITLRFTVFTNRGSVINNIVVST